MAALVELTQEQCLALLESEAVGRVALCTPEGPRIVPVSYRVHEGFVLMRTAPYTLLGRYGPGAVLALEADRLEADRVETDGPGAHLETSAGGGWSVVVRGAAEVVDDLDEIAAIRACADPEPWPDGSRTLYLRVHCREVTGRRLSGG